VKKLQNGVEIMKKGGNAFDAMVATELAQYTLRRKPWWWWIYGL
jgi:hypothetical protein